MSNLKVNVSESDKSKLPESVPWEEASNTEKLSKEFSEKLGRPVKASVNEREINILEFMRD